MPQTSRNIMRVQMPQTFMKHHSCQALFAAHGTGRWCEEWLGQSKQGRVGGRIWGDISHCLHVPLLAKNCDFRTSWQNFCRRSVKKKKTNVFQRYRVSFTFRAYRPRPQLLYLTCRLILAHFGSHAKNWTDGRTDTQTHTRTYGPRALCNKM